MIRVNSIPINPISAVITLFKIVSSYHYPKIISRRIGYHKIIFPAIEINKSKDDSWHCSYPWHYFNSLTPGDLDATLKLQFSILFYWLISLNRLMIILWDECHRTSPMISQHWSREWLGAVRQQAIPWANVDLVPLCHMASPGQNVLKYSEITMTDIHTCPQHPQHFSERNRSMTLLVRYFYHYELMTLGFWKWNYEMRALTQESVLLAIEWVWVGRCGCVAVVTSCQTSPGPFDWHSLSEIRA